MVHFDENSKMPFGQYFGQKLANVPAGYLLWLLKENKCYGSLKEYIEKNKDWLEREDKLNRKMENR